MYLENKKIEHTDLENNKLDLLTKYDVVIAGSKYAGSVNA